MTPADRSHHVDGVQPDGNGFLHNPEVAHEHSDINIRAVLAFAAGLAAVTIIVATIVWGLFRMFERQAAAADPQPSPLAVPTGTLPPEPRLQTNEPAGLARFRATETEKLETYGWVDEKSGVARMPIEDAKKLLLKRGLPVRPDAPADPLLGTHAAAMGESSSGRHVRQ